ncbi:hypothetical protein V6N12_025478 [Hibiscus sabdariffa]|uniref:Uncharacterized protein n=1 Tax=Hibiscus sabdariffa TaxID=183260 RepID=A0ABR2CIK2_9ROSI
MSTNTPASSSCPAPNLLTAFSSRVQNDKSPACFISILEAKAIKTLKVGKALRVDFGTSDDMVVAGWWNWKMTQRVYNKGGLVGKCAYNLAKTKLFNINVKDIETRFWANIINCGMDNLPTSDLGLPLGHMRNPCWNSSVFKDKSWSIALIFDLAVTRIGFWCKSRWPKSCFFVIDFIHDPILCKVVPCSTSKSTKGTWVKPLEGFLKFNVDTSIKGNYGEAGIGGCLRDHTSMTSKILSFYWFFRPNMGRVKGYSESMSTIRRFHGIRPFM